MSSSSWHHAFIIEVTTGFHSNKNEPGTLGPFAGVVSKDLLLESKMIALGSVLHDGHSGVLSCTSNSETMEMYNCMYIRRDM